MNNLFQTVKIESGFINNEETIQALKNNIQVTYPNGNNHLLLTWDFSSIINTANLSYRSEVVEQGGLGSIKSEFSFESSPPAGDPAAIAPTALFTNYPDKPAFRIQGFEANGETSYSIIIEDMADLNEEDDQITSVLQNPQSNTTRPITTRKTLKNK